MTRVVLFCPDVVDARMAGPGIRYWELAHALARQGLSVTLALPDATTLTSAEIALAVHRFHDVTCAQLAAAADVVVVQGYMLFHVPVLRRCGRPLAVDLYTPMLVENIANQQAAGSAERRRAYQIDLDVQRTLIEAGAFFFCASERQRDYWLGVLAALGRVTIAAHEEDKTLRHLIDVVPFGLPARAPEHTQAVLKGVVAGIEPEDCVALWGGGIWDWLDPETPLRGLAQAVAAHPELKLYFLGRGHPNPRLTTAGQAPAAARAVALAQTLGLSGTHVFFNQGWTPYAERENYLLEADIGISAHPASIETTLAFRTRVLDYIWAGLPMIVSAGDSLSDEVVGPEGLGRVVAPRAVEAWAAAFSVLAGDAARRTGRASAFSAVRARFTWDAVVRPLVAFLKRT